MCRIEEVEAIRQSIECLSQVKEKALMRSLGFSESEDESSNRVVIESSNRVIIKVIIIK